MPQINVQPRPFARRVVGGHHDDVETPGQTTVHHQPNRGFRDRARPHPARCHVVQPFVAEQHRTHAAPRSPASDTRQRPLVGAFHRCGRESPQHVEDPMGLRDHAVGGRYLRRPHLHDGAHLGVRDAIPRPGNDQHPVGAAGQIAAAQLVDGDLHTARGLADEVGELGYP
ncbi:hypothetical protein SDC9_191321 [bioreactor metagenome]|uniref:Uncharacterized protein n=1 Tax=bioreactor metagenome TaxID=1076179 RepID=A0A645HXK2_9ZZZZ